ncbi:beta-mannosidase [Trichophyton tonsurans CBS 112818]|uniref:Beta-mannosidase B n=1 Tax=Trichophyton tonsurans (strain CBS 112818) TaxID=647933 RepID=F2SAR9_TRIT1|nr:beta-mannosidase [Trichophyton tonsurans CBS 112818]
MGQRRFSPIDKSWTFREACVNTSKFLPVSQFPTCIHLDLIHHGIIPDPFTGTAEKQAQWVGEKAWVYRTAFVAPQLGENEKAVLAFDGLDTYASVHLNGKEILETDNMFIPERVDITSLLRGSNDESNVLEITFDSALIRGKEEQKKRPMHRWGCWNGDPSRLAVRKAQYHYGWDWGPVLLTCGPWRPITLEVYSARIADLYYTTRFKSNLKEAEISITAEVEGYASDVIFSLSLDTQKHDSGNQFVVSASVRDGKAAATIHLKNPQLWYPARYGSQPLYSLQAKLMRKDQTLDFCCKRIGLRKVELAQRKLEGSQGTTFLFRINDTSIFCGGSNWIPADSFIPRVSSQRYGDWVKMAVDGNQTMLCVWGGGIYEQDAFYEACDEYGLLVWQDFMFACGNYPAHREFLQSVEKEAEANATLDGPGSASFTVEIWVTNLTLQPCTGKVQLRAWDIVSGQQTHLEDIKEESAFPANQTMELGKVEIQEAVRGSGKPSQTVVAAYLIQDDRQVARFVNWPEPLKYIDFQVPRTPMIALSEDKRLIRLSAEVPVKGLAVFSNSDDVVFDDNCVDLVPGETVSIGIHGLKSGSVGDLTLRYLE